MNAARASERIMPGGVLLGIDHFYSGRQNKGSKRMINMPGKKIRRNISNPSYFTALKNPEKDSQDETPKRFLQANTGSLY
jgi:hypothetical protein